jgi:hypothetical protein
MGEELGGWLGKVIFSTARASFLPDERTATIGLGVKAVG